MLVVESGGGGAADFDLSRSKHKLLVFKEVLVRAGLLKETLGFESPCCEKQPLKVTDEAKQESNTIQTKQVR